MSNANNTAKSTKTTEQYRAEYRRIRDRADVHSPADFDRAVRMTLGERAATATPAEWVAAAKVAPFSCNRCGGTGVYAKSWDLIQGTPRGFSGVCYRCRGRGYQTDLDSQRNYAADLRAMREAIAA